MTSNDSSQAQVLTLEHTPTPEVPEPDLVAAAVRDFQILSVSELLTSEPATVVLFFEDEPARPKISRPSRLFSWSADNHGQLIVEDRFGAVYGCGHSGQEALADYYSSLDSHLAYLRRHEANLAENLRIELRQLENAFPDR